MVHLDADATLTPLVEAMDHSRDGYPRWIVAALRRSRFREAADAIVSAATGRGFVALTLDAYLRDRILDPKRFDERTLLLIDGGRDAARAHAALLQAAAQSPRPHLLLTLRCGADATGLRLVREARAAYAAAPAERDSAQVVELLQRSSRAADLVASGRHAAAERLLRETSAALARRGATRHAATVELTLGRMFLQRGRCTGASAAFDAASRFAHAARNEALAVEARIWQAAARIDGSALVDAEAICRAVLEAATLDASLKQFASAMLANALLWQGRSSEAPSFHVEDACGLDAAARVVMHDVRFRYLMAGDRTFDAGRCVERLRLLAAETRSPLASAVTAHAELTLIAATGDLARAAHAFDRAVAAAIGARMPLQAAWSRLTWIDALRRAGHVERAAPHLERLMRMARAAPLLLKREIERRSSERSGDEPRRGVTSVPVRSSSLAVALLRLSQDDVDEKASIGRLLARLAHELQASRVDLLSNAAGPVTTVCSAGDGLATRIGDRVLEAAFPVGPERQGGGWEVGVPVRAGTAGALVCRWPIDRAVPVEAAEVLELAAVIVAPRLDALLTAQREESKAATAVPALLGVSEAMASVRKAIVRAASAPFAVLIEGESGVGKELAARAVHHLSARRERKFCDLNCAALPEELLESELFGHARGAFSGAVTDRAGLFEEADGGTLFLDEVADLSPRAQAKLLRAIQQQEVRRVGESFSRKVDVRIIAAANRDMRAEAAAGRFRHDLLYRLDVIRIHIPPLRERPEDVAVLAAHCWDAATRRTGSKARLSPATLAELSRYHWPGNVRELQNVIASLSVAAPPRGWVRSALLPSVVSTSTTVSAGRLADAREQFERRFVEVALARCGGNRARAARSLGVSRQGLLKILARLGMDHPPGAAQSC